MRVLTRLGALVAATILVAGVLLAGTAGTASAKIWKAPAPDYSVNELVHLDEFENRILARINAKRANRGLPKVRYFSSCVDRFAERWAGHLAETGEVRHRASLTRILGRCHLSWVGETIAWGQPMTPAGAVRAWMRSPAHRKVIMKPRANRAGIGVRIATNGTILAVLNFGDSR